MAAGSFSAAAAVCALAGLHRFISLSLASSRRRVKDKVVGKINTIRACSITCPIDAKAKLEHEVSSQFNGGSFHNYFLYDSNWPVFFDRSDILN